MIFGDNTQRFNNIGEFMASTNYSEAVVNISGQISVKTKKEKRRKSCKTNSDKTYKNCVTDLQKQHIPVLCLFLFVLIRFKSAR